MTELNQLKIELYSGDIDSERKSEILNILEGEIETLLFQDIKGEYGHDHY